MRENLDKSFDILMEFEGGFVNDSNDKGGMTKYGISKKAYPNEDIENLTPARAKELYLKDYWIPSGCDDLQWPWDVVVFDTAVNMGPGTAKILAKEATWQDMLVSRAKRYSQIVQKNPSQLKYLNGWISRIVRLWEKVK